MIVETVKSSKFNPTLSFDGVAIIIACVTGCFWWGTISTRLTNVEKGVEEDRKNIQTLTEAVSAQSKNMAVLQQLVIDKLDVKK